MSGIEMFKAITLMMLGAFGTSMVVAGASPAVARPQGPIISFQMLVGAPGGERVLDVRGKPKGASDSRGTMKISPRLCEHIYELHFVYTTPDGHVGDRPSRRCPYSGLPRRGLHAMHVDATIDGEKVMAFTAKPGARAGKTFDRLSIPLLRYYAAGPLSGLARVRVSARYESGRVHVATFLADIGGAP
jgi:hypothetical protein